MLSALTHIRHDGYAVTRNFNEALAYSQKIIAAVFAQSFRPAPVGSSAAMVRQNPHLALYTCNVTITSSEYTVVSGNDFQP
jgi:hypothetical protein